MNANEMRAILEDHKKYLGGKGGTRANLLGADLQDANLRGADLRGADLLVADLRGANLRDVNLRGADLQDADLRGADLRGADLQDADLRGADLRGAYLPAKDRMITNLGGYFVHVRQDQIRIGCQVHTPYDWFSFDPETISDMADCALTWWITYKPVIQALYCSLPREI